MKLKYRFYRNIIGSPWLPRELKAIAHKKLRKKGKNLDVEFETDFFGLSYSGNLANNVEFNIYRYGAFEKHLLFFLRDTLHKLSSAAEDGLVFYDIGANIGQHSLYISQHAKEVHSFEPFEPVYSRLERHVNKNKIQNIILHKVGLSSKDEQLDFFAPTGHNQGIGSFDTSTIEKGNVPSGKLALVNGDDYIEKLKLPSVNMLKIDVEGFEKYALEGLQNTLKSNRPIIVCEVSYGKPLSFSSLEDFKNALPEAYSLFTFDNRKADGRKAKRRERKARHSGSYKLLTYNRWKNSGQDDIIACPNEKLNCLSMETQQ